jgi:hypothetical protein
MNVSDKTNPEMSTASDIEVIDLTPDNISDYGVCGYKDVEKHLELRMNIPAIIIDLKDSESAQKSPCPFGTFCIIYEGEIISHHPISNTRFENIMMTKKMPDHLT